MIVKLFPIMLIVLDFCAAVAYVIVEKDFIRAGYWLSAGFISLFAILM